jgi:hypothetical protein
MGIEPIIVRKVSKKVKKSGECQGDWNEKSSQINFRSHNESLINTNWNEKLSQVNFISHDNFISS